MRRAAPPARSAVGSCIFMNVVAPARTVKHEMAEGPGLG